MAHRWRLVAVGAALAWLGCGDGPVDPGVENAGGGGDHTRPTVTSVFPGASASQVSASSTIRVTFSEAMNWATVTTTSFSVSPSVSGSIAYSGTSATLTPSANLAYGTTYTVTVSTAVRDAAGNGLENPYAWSFTTEAAPISIPLAVGKRWRFEQQDTTTGCAASTGCSTSRFAGEHYVQVAAQTTWQGRSAWQVVVYTFQTNATSGSGFTSQTLYLFQDSGGLERWVTSSWRRLFSTQLSTYSNGAFFLAQGPSYNQSMAQGASSITVPAGSYSTLRVLHEYKETGQYAPRDIFVTELEHWAPGVGPVYGRWDFSLDDNDPAALDVTRRGSYWLTHVDAGPFPTVIAESEANDTASQADLGAPFMAATGNTALGDAGAVMSDAALGCTLTVCVYPNNQGVTRIEDWYRLDVTSSASARASLGWLGSTTDLDLYVFKVGGGGGLTYVNRSANPAGQAEAVTLSLTAGTYYIGVQAWDTPAGRKDYTLVVR